ncbi:hypothetical protein wVul_0497 [Wolbachia endosymbiont of Armadillidium vulgare str. wVulC]|uniref:hypothetical protein n=1 Tax=Wolbachia endosymbiont of Armadillidium vulgare TaxID=77039 RepID=UPI000649C721|nr:hypothetical protein [Wolbachia endosymbiont of Armadillidium vulgare]KLT23294.1 hypothetical protein wVul_0497 [Wolbachia endosymbiont of Armadillidium vulgare str. wVulC]OJH30873.1 hypothetical protein Wxf_00239 [Wolbachia endosymbiont of Armadillidium vulgare]
MEFLSYSSEQLKQYFLALSNEEKITNYRRLLKEAKILLEKESSDINQLKKLSNAAVAIEETTEQELLKEFNDDHPLRGVNVIVYPKKDGSEVNYLFSLSDSSELYDVKEDREKALYQAIKSSDIEIIKHLLIIVLPDNAKKVRKLNSDYLKELETFLSKGYKELEKNLSKDMKNYLEKKIRFVSFLCDFKYQENPIESFASQADVDYQIDKFLLSLIAENTKEKELLSKINEMMELLEKHERFDELEYKVRRLKSELEGGKSKYLAEIMGASIKEREREMREIEEKYIRPRNLINERNDLLKQTLAFKRYIH